MVLDHAGPARAGDAAARDVWRDPAPHGRIIDDHFAAKIAAVTLGACRSALDVVLAARDGSLERDRLESCRVALVRRKLLDFLGS